MNKNLKEVGAYLFVVVATVLSAAILVGVPANWIAVLGFLAVDLTTILVLGSVGRPPTRDPLTQLNPSGA
jgi:hypothetical protein